MNCQGTGIAILVLITLDPAVELTIMKASHLENGEGDGVGIKLNNLIDRRMIA